MTTLYDQLGVRPEDGRESVKQAFRDAIKASHPDIHPGDPSAPVRFRQIVRAHAILSDPELRDAYDRMLAFERQQAELPARRGFIAETKAKILADVIPIAVLVVVMLGVYAVFLYVTKPSDAAIGAVTAHAPPVVAMLEVPREVLQREELPREPAGTVAVAPAAMPGDSAAAVPHTVGGETPADLVRAPAPRDANFHRAQGLLAYRAGDFDRAIADLDLAIGLDPNFDAAYVDRGTVFYRLGQIDRAFADIAQAKRIVDANRAKPSSRRK